MIKIEASSTDDWPNAHVEIVNGLTVGEAARAQWGNSPGVDCWAAKGTNGEDWATGPGKGGWNDGERWVNTSKGGWNGGHAGGMHPSKGAEKAGKKGGKGAGYAKGGVKGNGMWGKGQDQWDQRGSIPSSSPHPDWDWHQSAAWTDGQGKRGSLPKHERWCVHFLNDDCHRGDTCGMKHPPQRSIPHIKRLFEVVQCRYGLDCRARQSCLYGHPPLP